MRARPLTPFRLLQVAALSRAMILWRFNCGCSGGNGVGYLLGARSVHVHARLAEIQQYIQ